MAGGGGKWDRGRGEHFPLSPRPGFTFGSPVSSSLDLTATGAKKVGDQGKRPRLGFV